MFSEVEQNELRILDALCDLAQEKHSLSAINDAVVVGQGHVHDWSRKDLAANYDGAHLRRMHTEDGTLGSVYDRGAHHATEDATVRDGESATRHILNRNLTVTSAFGQVGKTLLQVVETHILAVPDDGDDETGRRGDCSRDINEVSVNNILSINDSIDDGLLLECLDRGSHEGGHEAKLDAVLLGKLLLDCVTGIHNS